MDNLTDLLNSVRLTGTLLFHYELGGPCSVAMPQFPFAVFHYLSRGRSAAITLEDGQTLHMTAGDFVLISRGQPHILSVGGKTKPFPLLEIDRRPAHVGAIHLGGHEGPLSKMVCGYFSPSSPSQSSLLGLLPLIVHITPERDWLEAILQRTMMESAVQRPGHRAVLSRITELLFGEVLRTWITSAKCGEIHRLGALGDHHIGRALQLIHETPERAWTLRELANHACLGRSAFSARFNKLVGQSVHRYLVARRMDKAAIRLETSNDPVARVAAGVGYETAAAFSRIFRQQFGLTPARYRARAKKAGSRAV